MGFYNRTCSAGTAKPGPGVGPGLRAPSATNTWATFSVTVLGAAPGGGELVTVSTFAAPGAPKPLCMGNLVAEKPATCADARVHIHPVTTAGAAAPLILTRVPGAADNTFTIQVGGRGRGCPSYLSASPTCGATKLALELPGSGRASAALQQWVLEPVVEVASPSP